MGKTNNMKEGLFNFFEPTGLDHTTQNDPAGNTEMIKTASTAVAAAQSLGDRAAPSFRSLLPLGSALGARLPIQGFWRWDYHPMVLEDRTATQYIWRAEYWTKEDYSRALRSDGICLATLGTFLEPVTLYFFPISPHWNGNVYAMLIPPLCFRSTYLSSSTDS